MMFYGNRKALMNIKNYVLLDQLDTLGHKCFLFKGIKGLGKSIAANSLAKKLLCISKDLNCKCQSCYHFDNSTHPDLFIIKPSGSSIKKEQVLFINQEISTSATLSKYKIFIIDDADKMSVSAQTSLLKVLEEQEGNNIFILIAHNNLLPTIESRMNTITFLPINDLEVKSFLEEKKYSLFEKEILSCATNGQIGEIIRISKGEKFQAFVEFIKKLFSLSSKSKYDIIELFGEIKEKNPYSFYNIYKDYLLAFFNILSQIFFDIMYINLDQYSVIHFQSMIDILIKYKGSYSLNRLDIILQNIQNCNDLLNTGKLTTNEYFSLITILKEDKK
ncbi:AAA family ATPase [Vallitalea guaymasensis]|uniref:AAA family ATPase n=1 Tax=Vallitalea guaymasensis TaxID=1185412 RepID=UPI000DE4399C|nr:AAA family ATPase [Vallitalea guaymasensis]